MLFDITVKTEKHPNWKALIEAPDEWKARTKAMMVYPYKLAGAFVDYDIKEVKK